MADSPWRVTEEVADYFRTTPETIRYWKHIGKIRGIRVGRRTLYSEDEIKRLEDEAEAAEDGRR
jgi:excisionase family DNA binding protein